MTRRGATALAGILLVDKPGGMTSHDVVVAVRRATGEGRVGHAGTLDPMATGLLVVLVGPFTRLAPYLTSAEKGYEATIQFGSQTDTDDAEGKVVDTASVPETVTDPAYAREVLAAFLGPSEQLPPAYSALKVGGRTAHKAARGGQRLELAPRQIDVIEAELRGIDAEAHTWRIDFRVSKGTYIRALARDIGWRCGTLAHLCALRRVTSGDLVLADAHTLDEVARAASEGRIEELFADPIESLGLPALPGFPSDVRNGRPIPMPQPPPSEDRVAVTLDGQLAAIYLREGPRLVPEVVLQKAGAR